MKNLHIVSYSDEVRFNEFRGEKRILYSEYLMTGKMVSNIHLLPTNRQYGRNLRKRLIFSKDNYLLF